MKPGVVMLLANRDTSVGGAQRQARLLAEEVGRRGLRAVIVNQSPRARTTAGDDIEHVVLPVLRWAARPSFFLSFLVWATVNRRRFQLIHAHSPAAGLTAGLVGKILHRPAVVKITGMQSVVALADRGPTWRLRRFVLDRTAAVLVAVSTEMMQELTAIGITGDRRVLIPNGVRLGPLAAGARAATKREWLGDARGPVALYVGRLEEVKGVRRLLPVWSALARGDAATLVIVGDGPLRAELERDAEARGLGRSVRFLGSHREVNAFYRIADVFVLPSASEGLSNALLEAMAAGLPAVASDVGGNRDVIEDGLNGFLVDWTDTAAATRVLARLLDDAGLRRGIGTAARRRADRFSISAVADRYCQLYRTVLARTTAETVAVR